MLQGLLSVLTSVFIPIDEDCMREGIPFVPARLQNKRPKNHNMFEAEAPRRRESKPKDEMWEPSSNDEDESDSEDSMSDLYPRKGHTHTYLPTYLPPSLPPSLMDMELVVEVPRY